MPRLSRKDIDAIARRVCAAYSRLPGLKEARQTKVDPEILSRDLLGLTVQYHSLSKSGNILGLTACAEVDVQVYDIPDHPQFFHLDGRTLLIDRDLIKEGASEGRYHFTLMHEACHQIFKMLFPKEYPSPEPLWRVHFCRAAPSYDYEYWEEWRTNTLASAVLMPTDMICENMAVFGLTGGIRMLNRVYAPEEYDRFSAMAGHMGVSRQALAIRLKGLGLLKQDYLRDSYALTNVQPDDQELKCLRGDE